MYTYFTVPRPLTSAVSTPNSNLLPHGLLMAWLNYPRLSTPIHLSIYLSVSSMDLSFCRFRRYTHLFSYRTDVYRSVWVVNIYLSISLHWISSWQTSIHLSIYFLAHYLTSHLSIHLFHAMFIPSSLTQHHSIHLPFWINSNQSTTSVYPSHPRSIPPPHPPPPWARRPIKHLSMTLGFGIN